MKTASQQQLNAQQCHILLIDDDQQVLENMGVYLQDSGYDVTTATTGEQALLEFNSHEPSLILCDLRMPDIDGLELIKRFTELSPDIPIIVISGASQIQDVVQALRLGATDYLVKPITDFEVFDHAINSAIEKQKLTEQNQLYRQELEEANRELEANLENLKQDHEAGRQAQLQLLPPPENTFGNFQFSQRVIPSQILSGDFLDYFEIDDRYIGFYLADIQGHGTASAFVTMMLKSLINHPLRQYRLHGTKTILQPSELIKQLNKDMLESNIGKYMTLFYGVLDTQDNLLTYTMGGHFPKPLMLNNGELQILAEDGFPVGLFDWASYEQHQVHIESDFKIVMFSDGLLDVLSQDGLANKQEFLFELCLQPHVTLDKLLSELKITKSMVLPDDITIFIVQYNN